MQRQRFELKYVLQEDKALAVRRIVSANLALDEAGIDKPNFSYPVHSLYLDSHRLTTFWEWVNANRNRFKLRMRYYDADPSTPVFLEIKRRVSGCILKQRCAISKSAAQMVVDGFLPPEELLLSKGGKQRAALSNFIAICQRLGARPKALVTYLREAYVDPDNDGVRVTMDRQVKIVPRSTVDFGLEFDRWEQPFGDRVILELKFNNRFPNWFNDMVRQLGLVRGAAAKYCEGAAALWHPELGNMGPGGMRTVTPGVSSELAGTFD